MHAGWFSFRSLQVMTPKKIIRIALQLGTGGAALAAGRERKRGDEKETIWVPDRDLTYKNSKWTGLGRADGVIYCYLQAERDLNEDEKEGNDPMRLRWASFLLEPSVVSCCRTLKRILSESAPWCNKRSPRRRRWARSIFYHPMIDQRRWKLTTPKTIKPIQAIK